MYVCMYVCVYVCITYNLFYNYLSYLLVFLNNDFKNLESLKFLELIPKKK